MHFNIFFSASDGKICGLRFRFKICGSALLAHGQGSRFKQHPSLLFLDPAWSQNAHGHPAF